MKHQHADCHPEIAKAFDKLKTELAALRSENDNMRKECVAQYNIAADCIKVNTELRNKLSDTQRMLADALEALEKYGKHTGKCNAFPAKSEAQIRKDCDCGLAAALRGKEEDAK